MTFWQKTLGGLNFPYYIRHFLFGLIFFAVLFGGMVWNNEFASTQNKIFTTIILVILQILYPYSRFVYESVMNYIFGDNVFFVNALLMLSTKLITMMLCWCFAIFIAPIGLAYLYFHYTKQEKISDNPQ
ncbi:hypothetical protein [Caviibacterium pharyngocola]|uniref:Uncharacterized protein n=1 Tax=Caviibacterium pharyngocola TaxID=28159 RepID=A0A2M8RX64_9PAST|nr:hypothetical protein [Caviibacterium pharyngocola]PJG83462.1 hypothetical protein CVP04_03575 [Caviibacterium pharyngocola]